MDSRYITPLLLCWAELSEPFATVVYHVCASIPTLASKSMMIGSSSSSSMTIIFISFLTFPAAFALNGVCVSDGPALLWDLVCTRYVWHNFGKSVAVPSPY